MKNDFLNFRTNAFLFIKKMYEDEEKFIPAIILEVINEENKKGLTFIEIPEDVMKSSEGKNLFINKILPMTADTLKEKGIKLNFLCFASEIYIRKTDKDNFDINTWKDLPAEEALMLQFEDKEEVHINIYFIRKNPLSLDGDGKLVESKGIEFEKDEESSYVAKHEEERSSGTFSNMINKCFSTML